MSNKITDLLYEFNARADITIESLADLISDIAVPVVRCKDCVLEQGCKVGQRLGADGYCSMGERRDDETVHR